MVTDEPATEAIFSYGTLQLDSVQMAVFGRLLEGSDDALHGFAITSAQINDPDVLGASGIETHLALIPAVDAPAIKGRVFFITPDELLAADVYESGNYRRERVPLASGMAAWVYVKA